MKKRIITGMLLVTLAGSQSYAAFKLQPISQFQNGTSFETGAAEITAFDPATDRLFVVNGEKTAIDVLDLHNPAAPTRLTSLSLAGTPNSVDVCNGILAAVYSSATAGANGGLTLYSTADLSNPLVILEVGCVPDMVTFSPDGKKLLIANEGEPDYTAGLDPEGTISLIELTGGFDTTTAAALTQADVKTLSFNAFDIQKDALKAAGVRIFGDAADSSSAGTVTVSQDLEPEFIAISDDSATAWVTLQENNALAIIDLNSNVITSIVPLGTKDHNTAGNGLDASDKDGKINIANWPVKGMYLPDAIISYEHNGQTYIVMANEGDERNGEDVRVESIVLDNVAFPDSAILKNKVNLGRLKVSAVSGDTDGDGDYDELYSFGSRSFSIRDASGTLVYDSGDLIEKTIAALYPNHFNCDNVSNVFDEKSGSKGPEVEALALGTVNGKTLAFVGFEDIGGIMMFDISNPSNPHFVQYLNDRNFSAQLDPTALDFNLAATGDLGPEGLEFVPATESPNGLPMLIVANEVSGTTRMYAVVENPEIVYFDGHMHTTNSDGNGSLADIKTVALARGLNAVIVTNHTRQIDHMVNPTSGMNEWQEIVSTCATMSDDSFIMIPAFEVTGSEGTFCRDHVLAWGVSDPFVGPDSLGLAPEEVWPSPRNPKGSGPMFPAHIKEWVKYIRDNGGISVQAHTSGTTQPEYGVDYIEVWNSSHVKDIAGGAKSLGYSDIEATGLGVMFNNMVLEGDLHLFDPVAFPGAGTIPLRTALYMASAALMVDEYGNQLGQWVGVDPSGQTPNGTPMHTWDELLMMYVNGQLDHPTFGVANSDSHNTANIDPADTTKDYSDVGEAKNGVLVRGEVNTNSMLESVKRGHLFATTGPTIDVTLNGKIMGETLVMEHKNTEPSKTVTVTISANAQTTGAIIAAVKVIKNGQIISVATPNSQAYKTTIADCVTENCYYRVEVTSLDMAQYQSGKYPYFYAWSNPIFVTLNTSYPAGDSNSDGKVDMTDFSDLAKNWLIGTTN